MKIIIIGIQGCGKSTQGKILSSKLNIPHLSSGDIFRKLASEDSKKGKEIKSLMQKGILIPDRKVVPIIEEYLKSIEFENGYILDGFPRTLTQAKQFSQNIDKVVYIVLSDKEALWRIAHRKDIRNDETIQAVGKRIELFHERTEPLISYYRKKGMLVEIDGDGSIDEVSKKISDRLLGDQT